MYTVWDNRTFFTSRMIQEIVNLDEMALIKV